uniref:SCP domain-containing protein n=1 Tax=Mesocestoides corti TaxID=53468 RepID=A0A5K3F3L8_MESCO
MFKTFLVLTLICRVFAEYPSPAERAELIANFTKLREDVQPESSNMHLLRYSTELEGIANKWVSRCIPTYPFAYSYPEFENYGFVFSFFSRQGKFKDALFVANNSKSYNYEKGTCNGVCRYYKQAVWATSTRVGCAKQYCPKIYVGLVACAFNNANNRQVGRPYEKGPSCSKCPEDYSCVRKQCSPEPLPQPGSDEPTSDSEASSSTTTYASSSPPLTSTTTQKSIPAVSTTTPGHGNEDYIAEVPSRLDAVIAPSNDGILSEGDFSPSGSLKLPASPKSTDVVSSTPHHPTASSPTDSFAGISSVSTTSGSTLLLAFSSLHFAMLTLPYLI